MERNGVLLSSGSLPWLGIKDIIKVAKMASFDGIELVPTRKLISELSLRITCSSESQYIKGIHQNWRLDIGHDTECGLSYLEIPFFFLLRLLLFPNIKASRIFIDKLSAMLKVPVTVHGITPEWVQNNQGFEFRGGIFYELLGDYAKSPDEIKKWLKKKNHSVVIDTRDDQSLVWGKKYGWSNWRELWRWIGLKKIKNIQLTLIGTRGLKKIINRKSSLAEEQLIWLHTKDWKGNVTVEVNPLMLFSLCQGNIKRGLTIIVQFVKQTLVNGKKWSY